MTLLHTDAQERQVLWFTRFVVAIWLVKYVAFPFEEMAALPLWYMQPTGVVRWLPDSLVAALMHTSVLLGLRLVLIACCVTCLFPAAFRLASPALCVLVTLEQSLNRSFGHTVHPEIILMIATYVLTACSIADYRIDRRPEPPRPSYNRHAVPLVVTTLALCLTYSFVGIARLTTQPLEIFASHTLLYSIIDQSSRPWLIDLDVWRHITEWPGLLRAIELGFPLITAFEVMAPLCLVDPWFRRAFIVLLTGFHFVVIITMEIPFVENMLLFVLLLDWSRWSHDPARA